MSQLLAISHNQQGDNGERVIKWDEISNFEDTRYVSSPEAYWRISKNPLSYRSHPITRLAVHLPLDQPVFFQPGLEETALANVGPKDTTLTAWFKLCASDERACQYYYREIPQYYYFIKKNSRWTPRKKTAGVIGRIYFVRVKQVERYCLRLLLIDVKGATSFEDLRTVEGIQYLSFKQAAVARNLLQDDTSWDKAMEEAAAFQMPVQWRQLFVDICSHNEISNAPRLFEKYWFHLAEDYIKNGHNDQVARNLALHWIKDKLKTRGIDMEKELNMPAPDSALIEHFIRGEAGQLNENIRRNRMLRGNMM